MAKRYSFVDWAKTIAIFFVCVGHFLPYGDPFKIFLYTFHVPVYFIIAGFLWNPDKKTFNWNYVRNLTGRILAPYTVWFWLSAVAAILLMQRDLPPVIPLFFFRNGFTLWNSALWFLPCFFIVSVLHRLLNAYVVKSKISSHLLMAGIFIAIAYVFDYLKVREFLFGLNKCAFLLGVQYIGSVCKMIYSQKEKIIKQHGMTGVLLFLSAGLLSCYVNRGGDGNISLLNADYNNVFFYFPVSIIMSVSFLWSCMLFEENPTIGRFAKNTLPLLCGHYFGLVLLRQFVAQHNVLYLSGGAWIALIYFACLGPFLSIIRKYPRIEAFFRYWGFQT